jgi:ketosteroid isomerase-like protein
MKIILRLALLAAVIAAGVWLWTILFPSPEKAVRRQLSELARDASFSGNQSSLAVIAGAQRLANFFSTNVEVNLDVPGRIQHTLTGRDEIMQADAGARASLDGLKVEFPDVNVTVAPDKQSATADLTVKAQAGGDRDSIWQEMKFTLQKTGGKWLITRVETVRTLT